MNELSGSGESVFMCGNFQQMHDWHSIEKIPSSFVDVFTSGDTVSNINLKHACFATFIIISKIYLCAYNKFSITIITSVCCMYLLMLFPSIYLQVLSSWRTVLARRGDPKSVFRIPRMQVRLFHLFLLLHSIIPLIYIILSST